MLAILTGGKSLWLKVEEPIVSGLYRPHLGRRAFFGGPVSFWTFSGESFVWFSVYVHNVSLGSQQREPEGVSI